MMTDREKVIKTLTDALSAKENYPWAKAEMSFEFIEMLLELLKEQEDKIRQLRLALQIMNGNGIRVDTEGR